MESLGIWEYADIVKILLKNGEIIYCDIAEWIDDDPEELVLMPNKKTTTEWLLNRAVGITVDATQIKSIERLDDF